MATTQDRKRTYDIKNEDRQVRQKKLWNVVPSEFSQLCSNPIRKIVDNIRKPTDLDKELIPLSLGDPTVFGNLKCPDVMVEAIVRNVRSFKNNGYVHSAGMETAREAIADKFSTVDAALTKEVFYRSQIVIDFILNDRVGRYHCEWVLWCPRHCTQWTIESRLAVELGIGQSRELTFL